MDASQSGQLFDGDSIVRMLYATPTRQDLEAVQSNYQDGFFQYGALFREPPQTSRAQTRQDILDRVDIDLL